MTAKTRSASTLFAAAALVCVALIGSVAAWLIHDQYRLLQAMDQLRGVSLAKHLEQQRLVRNLEALRLEGERALFNPARDVRQKARFVVGVMANHPSITENAEARALAEKVLRLQKAPATHDPNAPARVSAWADLSQELAALADRLTTDEVAKLSQDVRTMESIVHTGVDKVVGSLLLCTVCMVALLAWLMGLFVHPLRQIHQALKALRANHDLPQLPTARTTEISAIQDALTHLQHTMRENETIRAGMEQLATTDGLTGLRNRRSFMTEAKADLSHAQRNGQQVCIGMADLDHFKNINDTHGHAAGDQVLKAFAITLQQVLRKQDLYCRFGGEEFAFLFPATSPTDALALGERLRQRVASTSITLQDGTDLRVTMSLGIADATHGPLDAALKAADDALYASKTAGRDRVTLHAPAAAQS